MSDVADGGEPMSHPGSYWSLDDCAWVPCPSASELEPEAARVPEPRPVAQELVPTN